MCRHACPVATASGHETYTPQNKMARLDLLRRGRTPWTSPASEPLWACTGCRHCTVYCEHGNEPGLVLLRGRAEANARGAVHPRLQRYPERFRAREERLAGQLRDQLAPELLGENAAIGFFPGCDAVDKNMRDVRDTMALLAQLGAGDVRVVATGRVCGGYPLLAAGYPDMFRWHASKVASELARYQTVILNCSACLYTMRSLYPGEGIALSTRVVPLSEFLADFATAIPAPASRRAVYYHDPCYLARYTGIREAPRRILSRVAEVRELAWAGDDTECCGGAGLLPKTMPDVADEMARTRLRELASSGGGTVVTSCATCAFMLKRNAPDPVQVFDLPGYLAYIAADAPLLSGGEGTG